MTDIVTLTEAKQFLRVTHDGDDAIIALMIAAASDAVGEYADAYVAIGEAPPRLKLAVLARVAASYDNREQVPEPKGERALIQPMRVLDL